MKNTLVFIGLLICFYCGNSMQVANFTTIRGIARESKAGLEVDGVIILGLRAESTQKYTGKRVEVTGIIESEHPWKIKPYKKGELVRQGFNMPVMQVVKSIKIIE